MPKEFKFEKTQSFLNIYIIIPAHNEAAFISKTLQSLVMQSLLPKKIVVVNDNSTDNTPYVVEGFCSKYNWITLVNMTSSNTHLPGAKIVEAFNSGLKTLDRDFDIICKFDADLIFPNNYLEDVTNHFKNNAKLGIASGFCYIEDNGKWILENLTNKDHIRGALKAYRKSCFEQIGGLKPSIGWDTVDELLAKYHDWELLTDSSLHVKHLKPTGASYNKASKYLQGVAMYKMRYGFWITLLSALKLAYRKKNITIFRDYISGYFKAKAEQTQYLVTDDEGQFIRTLRWKGILNKVKQLN